MTHSSIDTTAPERDTVSTPEGDNEFVPDAPPDELRRDGDVFIVPSSEGGGFDSIARSANELLSKINRIDFDAIGGLVQLRVNPRVRLAHAP